MFGLVFCVDREWMAAAGQVGSDRLRIALGTASLMCGQAGRRKYG
jgi:hypothetical protein